ncbi:MAG TPA: FMN-binding negative transcriptional regulator [Solirubrobacterales bacterium]|nr:FMN-binding negative transcriptional regulator [Solirubrobacterales bacterium]
MRQNPYYELTEPEVIRRLIRENPWATLVSSPSTGLVASHYPIMLEDDREEISIVTHVGRPDEKVHELGSHELLVIVQGPHGYISSSWYGDHIEVPTWNFIVAHLSGVPEILEPKENFEILTRLVDRFERHVASPRPLDATPEVAADARRDSRGTIGLRLVPTRIVAKRKMSQNKSPEIVETVLRELEGDGPYASPMLAREMRLVHETDSTAGNGGRP